MPRPKLFMFDAIGTRWWIEDLSDRDIADTVKKSILKRANDFNQAFTRFNDSSLVGRLNRGQTITNPPAELISLLSFAKKLYDDSQGAFNISVGGELHRTGYGSRDRSAPIWDNPWNAIHYDSKTVFIPSNMTIDFGGLGKGWLIDSFTEILNLHSIESFIINGGGDMFVQSNTPIDIALEHPFDSTRAVGSTTITNGALAVSGNSKRQWNHMGKMYQHLVDPNGVDTAETAAVYVKAPTAAIADAMATILFLRPELQQTLQQKYKLNVVVLQASQLKN